MTRKDNYKYKSMEKTFIAAEIAAAVCIILLIVFTGGKSVRDDVSLDELKAAASAVYGNSLNVREAQDRELKKYYGLNAGDYEDIYLALPASNMDAAEILIIVMNGREQAGQITEAMNARLDAQINAFESYGVEQMELLNNAVIETEGRYAFYISSKNASEVKEALEKLIR